MKTAKQRFTKIISTIATCCLLLQQTGFAQLAGQLDLSYLLNKPFSPQLADVTRLPHLRYFAYDDAASTFRLLIEKGYTKNKAVIDINNESKDAFKYFLTGISLPNAAFWVNLKPDSENKIIDKDLALTELGRVMLEADLQLKKDTAAFTSPANPTGKAYWEKLYKKADEIYGASTIVTIPTLTRPWIVPGEVILNYSDTQAYVYKATLKVMLEQDYIKGSNAYSFKDSREKALNEYSSQLIRELIIPQLTKEVNTSLRYAKLRQVYYSLILAQYFKGKFSNGKGTYATRIDKKDLTGLASAQNWSPKTYFDAYKKSFQEGEYNLQEPVNTAGGKVIRSYFSGGANFSTIFITTGIGGTGALTGKVLKASVGPDGKAVTYLVGPDKNLKPEVAADNKEKKKGSSSATDVDWKLVNYEVNQAIRKAIENREFAAVKLSPLSGSLIHEALRPLQCPLVFTKGEPFGISTTVAIKEQNIQLNSNQLEVLVEAIFAIGSDFAAELDRENITLIFIKGQKTHYSIGRDQIYLDASLLDNAPAFSRKSELIKELLRGMEARKEVLAMVRAMNPQFIEELKRTKLNPERRSLELINAINVVATGVNVKQDNLYVGSSPAAVTWEAINDDYTRTMRPLIQKGEFAAVKMIRISEGAIVPDGALHPLQWSVIFEGEPLGFAATVSADQQKIRLNEKQLKALDTAVYKTRGLNDKLEWQDITIIFIEDQTTHFSIGRPQIYLDLNLLNPGREIELNRQINNAVAQREVIRAKLKALNPAFIGELENTKAHPERRSSQLRKAINEVATEVHDRYVRASSPAEATDWVLLNEDYNKEISLAIQRGEFAAARVSLPFTRRIGVPKEHNWGVVQDSIVFEGEPLGFTATVSVEQQKIRLNEEQLETVKAAISRITKLDDQIFWRDFTLIFIKGQRTHYSLGRAQIYLDVNLLSSNRDAELDKELLRVVQERREIVNALRAQNPLFIKQLEETKAHPENRSGELVVAINQIATKVHAKYEKASSPATQFQRFSDAAISFEGPREWFNFEDLASVVNGRLQLAADYEASGEEAMYPEPTGQLNSRFGYKDASGALRVDNHQFIVTWTKQKKADGARLMIHFGIGGQGMSNSVEVEYWGTDSDANVIVLDRLGRSVSELFQDLLRQGYKITQIVLHVSSKSGGTDEPLSLYQEAINEFLRLMAIEKGMDNEGAIAMVNKWNKFLKDFNKGKQKDQLFKGMSKAEFNKLFNAQEQSVISAVFDRIIFSTSRNAAASRLYAFVLGMKELNIADIAAVDFSEFTGGRFTENCETGDITQVFQGVAVDRDALQEQAKKYLGKAGNDPKKNSALRAATLAYYLDPSFMIVAVRGSNARSEALQKEQLFPESNGKDGQGIWVVTSIGEEELKRKVEQIKLQTGTEPLVVVVDQAGMAPMAVPEGVPVIRYFKEEISPLANAKFALWFQEFTVRYGLLSLADMAKENNLELTIPKVGASLMNKPVLDGKPNFWWLRDPQNQPMVELAKGVLVTILNALDKSDEAIKARYQKAEERIRQEKYIDYDEINIADETGSKSLDKDSKVKLLGKARLEIAWARQKLAEAELAKGGTVEVSEVEFLDTLKKIKGLKDKIADLSVELKRAGERLQLQRRIEDVDKQIYTLYQKISGFGKNMSDFQIEKAAEEIAALKLIAKDRDKVLSSVFYTASPEADILGEFLQDIDYGIGTRDQHANFQHRHDGKDVVSTLLVDVVMPYERVVKTQKKISTYGLANDYLDGMYTDEVRRGFVQAEFKSLSGGVTTDAIDYKGNSYKKSFHKDVAILMLPDISTPDGMMTAARIFNRAKVLFETAAGPHYASSPTTGELNRVDPNQLVNNLLATYRGKSPDELTRIGNLEKIIRPSAVAIEDYFYTQFANRKIPAKDYEKGMKNVIPNLAEWYTDPYVTESTYKGIEEAIKDGRWAEIAQAFFDNIPYGTAGVRGRFAFGADFKKVAEAAKQGRGLKVPLLKGPNTFNDEVLRKFTLGILKWLESENPSLNRKDLKLFTAYDSRIAGKEFAEIIKNIGLAFGVQVYVSDETMPLPEFSASLQKLSGGKAAIGIFVSASHNVKLDNGVKLIGADGMQLGADEAMRTAVMKEFRSAKLKEVDDLLDKVPYETPSEQLVFMGGKEKLPDIDYGNHSLVDTHTIHAEAILKHIKNEDVIKKYAKDINILYCSFHGAGIKAMPRALRAKGFNVEIIDKMAELDGTFPEFADMEPPDPALVISWKKAITAYLSNHSREELLKKDFFTASDPDADRFGLVVRVSAEEIPEDDAVAETMGVVVKLNKDEQARYGFGGFRVIPPNEWNALIIYYDLNWLKAQGKLDPKKHILVSTHVTTLQIQKIAELFGVEVVVKPVGVDQVASEIVKLEEKGRDVVAGPEESGTYTTGNHIRDKDGFLAGVRVAEIASALRAQGRTLNDFLDEINLKVGFAATTNFPIEYEVSVPGTAAKIAAVSFLQKDLQPAVRETIRSGGNPQVVGYKLYDVDEQTPFISGKYDKDLDYRGYPDAGIRFYFNQDKTSYITDRPSGTGPQLRFYSHLFFETKNMARPQLNELKKTAYADCLKITKEWMRIATDKDITVARAASPATLQSDNRPGGIDFRYINLATQAKLADLKANFKMPALDTLKRVDIENEAVQIRKMLNAGIIPSEQRVMEYITACYVKGNDDAQIEEAAGALSDLLRMQEDGVVETRPELKAFLVVMDSR
ncbi:MAG: hypothetical protein ABSB18_00310 [Candidatus Omnitrophota bacterium]